MPGKKAKPYKRNLTRIMIGTRKMAVLGLSTHSLSDTPSSEEITIQRNRVSNSRQGCGCPAQDTEPRVHPNARS